MFYVLRLSPEATDIEQSSRTESKTEWSHSMTTAAGAIPKPSDAVPFRQAYKKCMDADCWQNGQQRLQAYVAGEWKEILKHERHILSAALFLALVSSCLRQPVGDGLLTWRANCFTEQISNCYSCCSHSLRRNNACKLCNVMSMVHTHWIISGDYSVR